jgi:hypothetical protein
MEDNAVQEYSRRAATEEGGQRSASDNVRELTEASKQLIQAGKQMSDNLSELSDRMEHAKNVTSQVLKSPWLLAGGAMALGALMLMTGRHR